MISSNYIFTKSVGKLHIRYDYQRNYIDLLNVLWVHVPPSTIKAKLGKIKLQSTQNCLNNYQIEDNNCSKYLYVKGCKNSFSMCIYFSAANPGTTTTTETNNKTTKNSKYAIITAHNRRKCTIQNNLLYLI